MKPIVIKRVYENKMADDSYRILVDRLWPRGILKADLALDEWDRAIAPSTPLRRWFNHEAAKFEQFEIFYRQELEENREELARLRTIAQRNTLTLLYGAKDASINHANILRNVLKEEYEKANALRYC